MGHCIHIYFERAEDKQAAFENLKALGNVKTIKTDTIQVIDSSSNSDNFITNTRDFLEVEIEVKTVFLSRFILDKLSQYRCFLKDCEDAEEESFEPLTSFFRI